MSDRDDAAPTRTRQKSQRTKTEGWRQDLKRRFREHITMNWVLDFEIPKEEQQFDFHYVANVEDFVIYYCILTKKGSDEKDKVWLLWNGDEVYSTRDEEGLIVYFVSEMYERIRTMRWNFITSPVLVSGTLAVAMIVIIAILLFWSGHPVPPELWTVFTAVIAFYFGKGNLGAERPSNTPQSADRIT